MADTVGMQDLRGQLYDKVVKNYALREFKMLPLCSIVKTNAWKNTYYQETDSDLTGGTGSAVAGVPRLAAFPQGNPSWTQTNEYVKKYGMEVVISKEDSMLDAIDVNARALLRCARAVAYAVDAAIITELATTTNTSAAAATWDNAVVANRNPIYDILSAIEGMIIDNWDPTNGRGYVVLHPTNYKELMSHEDVKNSSRYYSSTVTENGKLEYVCGLQVVVSNSSTENTVLFGIKGDAMAWYEAEPLTTVTIDDPGVKTTIRSFTMGVPVLINNNAAYKLTAC